MYSLLQSTLAPVPKGVTLLSRKPTIPLTVSTVCSFNFFLLINIYIKYIFINLSIHNYIMQIWSKHIREKLKDIDEFLLEQYKENNEKKKRNWRTYEEQYALRIKEAMNQLKPLVDEAIDTIEISKVPGRPHKLTLKQRVLLLLLQRLFQKSNRIMASMLAIFSILSGVDVSYKTVERLYSDEEVEIALHNLHTIILRKKGVNNVDATGDGTGYSLTVRKHYATEVEKKKRQS